MQNFMRALRLALRYRWTVAGTLLSALCVALLWGGNIGVVYPVVEVVLKKQSLQQWAVVEMDSARRKAAELGDQIARIDALLAAPAAELPGQLAVETAAAQAAAAAREQASGAAAKETQAAWERAARLEWLTTQPPETVRDELVADRALAVSRQEAEVSAAANVERLKPYIDRYLPADPFQTLLWVLGLLVLGTVVKGLFVVGNTILAARLASLSALDLRKRFYRNTLAMDLGTFTADGTGELMSRFTFDLENVADGLNSLFGKAVREPLKMLACFIGAAMICWRLLVLSMIIVPLAVFLIDRLARVLKKANRKAMEEMSQIYSTLEETFQGIKVVKAFTMERAERRRFHRNSKRYFLKTMRIARYDSLTRPMTELMGILGVCLAIAAGAYLVLADETHLLGVRMSARPLSMGSLMVFYGLFAGTSDPFRKLSEVFGRLQRAAAASDRVYALLDRQPQVRDPEKARPLARHHRDIAFRDVSFSYAPSVPVLRAIDLAIPFGETIAFVGANGCGKSTLVNLLPRFFDPVEGGVSIDGVDLREVRLRDVRRQIGLVTQETLLFDDTVFNNIRYGSPQATREQVVEAAKQAHAHRFIEEKLEHGYDSIVGSRGNLLSGGQRQRIALARAILRDPAILILDEATSQIDLESEQLIHKVLEKFTRGRTTLLITHRLSTLTLADRVVVMDSGRIADIGTHDELIRRCAHYSRLHELQLRQGA